MFRGASATREAIRCGSTQFVPCQLFIGANLVIVLVFSFQALNAGVRDWPKLVFAIQGRLYVWPGFLIHFIFLSRC